MDRVHVTFRLSDEAHKGWVEAAHRSGVTLTALIEAAGQLLHEKRQEYPTADLVERARLIDLERRTRR